MKKLAIGLLLLWPHVALAQYNPPTYIQRSPNGGYVITQPGSRVYRPPIYVEPMPWNRGIPNAPRYQIVQPGANQPPAYLSPSPNGGAVITQPGR